MHAHAALKIFETCFQLCTLVFSLSAVCPDVGELREVVKGQSCEGGTGGCN